VTITLAPNESQLTLEYSEAPEPGAERFFHHVISIHSRPKLLTGHSQYSVDTEQAIDYCEIPSQVVREARSWLESNLATAKQDGSLARVLSEYLNVLKGAHG
jgi:hypothetical protein